MSHLIQFGIPGYNIIILVFSISDFRLKPLSLLYFKGDPVASSSPLNLGGKRVSYPWNKMCPLAHFERRLDASVIVYLVDH